MSTLYLTRDLMFSSRVAHIARQADLQVATVSTPAELPSRLDESVERVVIDLAAVSEKLDELVRDIHERRPGLPIVAYGPHVDEEGLARAAGAGCRVMTRGQFDQQIRQVLQSTSVPNPPPPDK